MPYQKFLKTNQRPWGYTFQNKDTLKKYKYLFRNGRKHFQELQKSLANLAIPVNVVGGNDFFFFFLSIALFFNAKKSRENEKCHTLLPTLAF